MKFVKVAVILFVVIGSLVFAFDGRAMEPEKHSYTIGPYRDKEYIPTAEQQKEYRAIVEANRPPAGMYAKVDIQPSADERGPGPDNNVLSEQRGEWAYKFFKKEMPAGTDVPKPLPLGYAKNEKKVEVVISFLPIPVQPVKASSEKSTGLPLYAILASLSVLFGYVGRRVWARRSSGTVNGQKKFKPKEVTVHYSVKDEGEEEWFMARVMQLGPELFTSPIRPEMENLTLAKLQSSLSNDTKHFQRWQKGQKVGDAFLARSLPVVITDLLNDKVLERRII